MQTVNTTLLSQFLAVAKTAKKIVPPSFYTDHRYYIFKDNYQGRPCYVLYSQKKGTSYNIFGSHWFYYHDLDTGEFIQSFNGGVNVPKDKERMLKADLVKLHLKL